MAYARRFGALCILLASTAGLGSAWAQVAPVAPTAAPLPPAVAPASGEAAAFRAELLAGLAGLPETQRTAIDGFYAARDYAPFWTEAGADRVRALHAAAEAAPAQGLPRYAAAEIAGDAPAAQEVAATRLYLTLATAIAAGILTPSNVDPEIEVKRMMPATSALLDRLKGQTVEAALASVEPQSPDYRRLIAEKARLEALVAAASWGPAVSPGETLHPGESGPRVAELRARLARLGYATPAGDAAAFDPALVEAVQRFQRDFGLGDDGVVGAKTLDAVNASAETRLAQVVVNLERMRWLNRDLGARHLLVNIPDFSVNLFENGAPVWYSRVVVGALKTKTPEFSGTVTYLVANPTWHIPDSIAIRDYLPKLQHDPMVLKRQNIDLMTRGGTVINPKLVDFAQYTPENFPFRIKQRPNDDNALGFVKFMFPNKNSVYMHDTPHKELFPRDVRAFSNGCIRVEKPRELAEILLAGQEADPAAAFQGWLDAKSERTVTLERPVQVHITYRTVLFDGEGNARYRADVYGRDAAVFRALEAAGVTIAAAQG